MTQTRPLLPSLSTSKTTSQAGSFFRTRPRRDAPQQPRVLGRSPEIAQCSPIFDTLGIFSFDSKTLASSRTSATPSGRRALLASRFPLREGEGPLALDIFNPRVLALLRLPLVDSSHEATPSPWRDAVAAPARLLPAGPPPLRGRERRRAAPARRAVATCARPSSAAAAIFRAAAI